MQLKSAAQIGLVDPIPTLLKIASDLKASISIPSLLTVDPIEIPSTNMFVDASPPPT